MKQAVVLIHGIGEQKPMATLRGFVDSVLGPGADGKEAYWSKPDPLSELFELRRLQSTGRTKTHFYEYYWAYNVEGTTLVAVLAWLLGLIRRSWKDVPSSSRSLWILARTLVALVAVTFVFFLPIGVMEWIRSNADSWSIAWWAILGVAFLLQGIVIAYLGDAARYLSPRPANIRLRQSIRSQGVKLLRDLHERGNYDRIVVVGHSLGSVIGYDLITHLWLEFNEKYHDLASPQVARKIRDCMDRRVSPQAVIRDELLQAGSKLDGTSKDALLGFRKTQRKAWREQRRLGNPWRISDFITLGSPLTHAMLLLASSSADFESRKRQRELPTCPPQVDEKGYAYGAPVSVDVGQGRKYTPLVLHHAAPFAVTAWTNLYHPARWGLFGDIVGGPLQQALGPGIEDVPVRTLAWRGLANYTLSSHTKYWQAREAIETGTMQPAAKKVEESQGHPLALPRLKAALALEYLRKFRPGGWLQLRESAASTERGDEAGPKRAPGQDHEFRSERRT